MIPTVKQFFSIFLGSKKHSFSYQSQCWKQTSLLVKQVDYWALLSQILSSEIFAK